MVLIKDDNLPSLQWQLGRIQNVIRGEDGLVRVAHVQTAKNIIRRPITKLAPLPTEQEAERKEGKNGEVASGATRSKRPRLNLLASTLLAILLFLPLCLTEGLQTIPFKSSPGIYFENIGTAHLLSSEWKIVSYVNITPYWTWTERLKVFPSQLHQKCKIARTASCFSSVSLLEHLIDEIELSNALLEDNNKKREKRGAFNIVGSIAHSLFGVLDEEYATDTANIIINIGENEKRIVNEINRQKTFLDNTINIIKKDQQVIENEFHKIEHFLKTLGNSLQQEIHTNEFTDLALQATLLISYLHRMQQSLLDALIDSRHGSIHPELISPIQLEAEIRRIKIDLPATLKLPETTDLLKLLHLMQIESRIVGNLAIFIIRVPLVNPEEFEILRLIPVPFVKNNLTHLVETNYGFLIINLHRDQYYMLNDHSLTNCVTLENDKFFCHTIH